MLTASGVRICLGLRTGRPPTIGHHHRYGQRSRGCGKEQSGRRRLIEHSALGWPMCGQNHLRIAAPGRTLLVSRRRIRRMTWSARQTGELAKSERVSGLLSTHPIGIGGWTGPLSEGRSSVSRRNAMR